MTSIRQILESWAHWRHTKYSIRHQLGYGKSIFAKLLDGMPGTNCPTCRTSGKYQGHTCPTCSGLGRIKLDPSSTRLKINPATIKCTHLPEDNPLFYVVDRAVCKKTKENPQGLPKQQYRVLWSEYVWHISEPTQAHRAARLRLSHGNFMTLLHLAHQRIEQRLKNDRSSTNLR